MIRPKCVKRTRLDKGERLASVCSYCSDKAQGEIWAEVNRFDVSHTICSSCLVIHFPGIPAEVVANTKAIEGHFID